MTAIKVILNKSWTNKFGKKYPIGTIIPCDKDLSARLINEGYGEKYEGKYPPKAKVKTDFFNKKTIK
jgi:hypothetical protein